MHFEKGNWLFELQNHWLQFLHPTNWNWITFQFFMFELEWDRHLGGIEMTFVLFGLGFRIRYTYKVTEMMEQMQTDMKNYMEGIDIVVPRAEYEQLKADAASWRGLHPE